ncbi:MAG TPA: amidohydrolase family protein [Bacillota bacterium]|nr:amidohydrolase family protein [Bacillota bacterium]HPP60287.1 amidohydrolase family protein [Bacillota bacterium]HPV13447.1 amidohydrolase family protein [Bacillota bacterium]HPZ77550.1 amidohydrolase family protein [Bacillota bacterium]HQD73643.1 amidohydrolase family protein [Bacillota bacterium]
MTFDVIIRHGELVDGTGAPAKRSDVGISGDRITAVGDLSEASARLEVDASGKVVCPGFIDMHSHADQTVLLYPDGESAIGQGITTVVCGQCGFSPAPLNEHYLSCFWEWNWWDKVAPRKYYQEPVADLEAVRKHALDTDGLDINWSSFGEWLDRVRQVKPSINMVPLVGHGSVRAAAMGEDYRRAATDDEIRAMKRYVEESMDQGACGISNGLDYAPNSYATIEESYEVIGAAIDKGGIFCSHWWRTGLRQGFGNPGLINGVKQALDIAMNTGAKIELAHLSPGYLLAPSSTPKLSICAAEETLDVIDRAIRDGVDVSFDVIPNHTTGGVLHAKYLAALLEPWLKEAGDLERFSKNLRAPDLRQEIKQYILSGKWYSLNPVIQPGWAERILIGKTEVQEFTSKTVAQIADEKGCHPLDALMDIISMDPYSQTATPPGSDEVKRVFYSHPRAMVGVDTFLFDHTAESRVPPYYLPNPNTFGGMARYIKLYALGLLGLEEGIKRITSQPAKWLGLRDRGVISQGMKADIVVFAPEEVTDKGTDDEPRRYSEGFRWVFVNGKSAMENGILTAGRSGQVLYTRPSAL